MFAVYRELRILKVAEIILDRDALSNFQRLFKTKIAFTKL